MRTKHTFRLPPDLAGKLADYAARTGQVHEIFQRVFGGNGGLR